MDLVLGKLAAVAKEAKKSASFLDFFKVGFFVSVLALTHVHCMAVMLNLLLYVLHILFVRIKISRLLKRCWFGNSSNKSYFNSDTSDDSASSDVSLG